MIATKNKSIRYNGIPYELFLSMEDAQHIAENYYSHPDPGDHLNFTEIENLILSGKIEHKGKHRYYIRGRIDGKLYMAVVYLINRKCVIKSGRICNYFEF